MESRAKPAQVGCVVIGRNEGERLRRCLASVADGVGKIVYVDSGSTDGSVALAKSFGAEVVVLPSSVPFTAARARNAGVERLREIAPDAALVQLVDGDCEIVSGWLEKAVAHLRAHEKLAVVCGRRRERYPERSVYNRVCDVEWDTPVGPARSCGGDALMRVSAFVQVGGFDPTIIAGEEPELCYRLRSAGWAIERLPFDMTLHDAAITRFDQWWQRAKRAGHAFAEGAALHGGGPERFRVAETRRAVVYGAVLPTIAIGGVVPTLGMSLGLLSLYAVSGARVFRATRRRGYTPRQALEYGFFVTLGKLPELAGVMRYYAGRVSGRRSRIIEYKGASSS